MTFSVTDDNFLGRVTLWFIFLENLYNFSAIAFHDASGSTDWDSDQGDDDELYAGALDHPHDLDLTADSA